MSSELLPGLASWRAHTVFSKPVGEFVWSLIKDLLLYGKGFSVFSVRNPILFCGGKTMKWFQKMNKML